MIRHCSRTGSGSKYSTLRFVSKGIWLLTLAWFAPMLGIADTELNDGQVPKPSSQEQPDSQATRVILLSESKAILLIKGRKRVLKPGEQSPEGVKVIEVTSQYVVIEVAGQRETLRSQFAAAYGLGGSAAKSSSAGPKKVRLFADNQGFFHASGTINGYPVKFLVDTGANTIGISSALARRIGIDLQAGKRGMATTASGVTPMVQVKLGEVAVGDITINNVDAGVLIGNHPRNPLLGMSFLSRVDMHRVGNHLELIKKY